MSFKFPAKVIICDDENEAKSESPTDEELLIAVIKYKGIAIVIMLDDEGDNAGDNKEFFHISIDGLKYRQIKERQEQLRERKEASKTGP